jgi:hypothetical protein
VVQAWGVVGGHSQLSPTHCCPAGQTKPQLPQLFASRVRSAQYVGAEVGQAACASEQVWTQLPAEQSWPAAQAWPAVEPVALHAPDAPQWFLSVCGSMHVPPQFTSPAWHVSPHVPPEQTFPAGQALPQAPQLALSVWTLVQAPPQTREAPLQSGVSFAQPATRRKNARSGTASVRCMDLPGVRAIVGW